ncbi:MAG: transcription termination/antitermination protein NusA [Leptolyngbya sp. PLA2]|nr:transcription termination/antitermination protein NusA [Leptolyngbya sp.]MCE7971545.1 transcription termination/antitermination protein NusA [Leptolyngbya sp. PL-A2]MCZ7632578.1 transcription termination factor NusA [Phycisphaerales bacterium]MDL1904966.1 transcription termination/antitermination protein NusA [Synechococcales cyanobacterium CNB]GIK19865.1 MAG: transcription termination/antitermination protein NusA [Planctomycetota bacterium]
MNTQEMMRIIDSISRDRNIDRQLLIADLEAAMVSAARRYFNTLDTEEFTCSVDPLSGQIQIYRHGQPLEMPPEAFGRIAAQTFKQVMIQRFREDERNSILEEFSKRVGEIATGVAQRYEGGALVVTVDRAEAFMPRSEQIPGEQFQPGDRVRCLILDVRDAGNQVKIVLSRAHPDFIKRLFEVEVPEVAERIIEIKAMAREAGYRTKIAVSSIDSKVDAVGACVGVRGSRIKNIVDELNGEKIDIIRWNESSQILIQNSLKPAEVQEISLCFELGRATVVVRDDQLSLAIGKRGQNVRLAARLTGWDVDILTPEEFNKGLEIMSETLLGIEGVTEEHVDRLAALGIVSVFDVEEVGAEVLATELELDESVASAVVEAASARAKIVAEQQQREKEEAEARRKEEEEAARRLLSGEGLPTTEEGAVDPELAAAAILGIGTRGASGGGSDGGSSGGAGATSAAADERAADILGGDKKD